MKKADWKKFLGIAICAAIIIWFQIKDCRDFSRLGPSEYFRYQDQIDHTPQWIMLLALAIIGVVFGGISFLFKNKLRFLTFWMIYIFVGPVFSVGYLIYLWARDMVKSRK